MNDSTAILIYGVNQQAQQICEYIRLEQKANLIGFMADEEYKRCDELLGLPVYESNEAFAMFPPSRAQILLSFGYKNMVRERERVYFKCKGKGYTLYTFISKDAHVYTDRIGEGTVIYPGCVIAPFSSIGPGCFLGIGVTIEHHCTVDEFCFLATRTVLCGNVHIAKNCFLGANSTVIHSINLAERTLVGAGAIVTKDTNCEDVCFPARGSVRQNGSSNIII